MNWRPFRCIFGVHDLTGWRTVKPSVPPRVEAGESGFAQGPHNERHCKRPGYRYKETKPHKLRKRAPTSADTISPKV